MTCFVLKITSALLAVAYVVKAAPLGQACAGGACHQAVNSGSVALGSTTNIVPLTQVTPITRYQPVVQAYAPLVQSQLNCPFDYPVPLYGGLQNLPPPGASLFGRVHKRATPPEQVTGCIPSAGQPCVQSVPASTTDMGSFVKAEPSNVILPSTVYQGHVKAEAADIEAAEAQHAQLSRSQVNLGADTFVQPVTKVMPSTTYQPSVAQKATVIEMAPQMDQSLARSSASMGSTVVVRPTTTVEPLTIFQPKIKSLPFIISDEACP